MNFVARPMEAAGLRGAQAAWAERPVRERLAVVGRLRRRLAAQAEVLAATAARPNMSVTDILVAEVMPLLAACRFLEQQAGRLLAPRRPAGRRPVWLFGTSLLVRRVPFGVVLIVGPNNYPLLLPAVQAVQALTAGNAVMVKPAPGIGEPMRFLAGALRDCGLPDGVFSVLADTDAAGEQALRAGADKVVLTGGADTGRTVLAQLAETLTPATMELSGDDAMIVLPGAPIETVARAIGYALLLNGGETCIAPRRILAVGDTGPALADRLATLLPGLPQRTVAPASAGRLRAALATGEGRLLGTMAGLDAGMMRPVVWLAAHPDACLPPIFGPVATLMGVADIDTAVVLANGGAYSLGASVFGPVASARAVARRLRAGCVVVNDVIGPTADPRLPFGGRATAASGLPVGRRGCWK